MTCTANSCTATEVVNSNKATAESITGTTGQTVVVTCDLGFTGSGSTTCSTSGTFISLPTCIGNTCTPTGNVANKNETKQLMLRIKGEDTFNPELEVTRKEFLREMTSNVPLSLGAMTSQHKVIKHLERQKLKSTFLSSSVQILLLFHAPFSAKGFLYFDCHKMGEKSFIRKDYGIECWSEKWNTFLPFAIILVFGF